MKHENLMKMIINMESNTFLLPNAWSEEIQMTNKQEFYRSYVGTRGGYGRYINFEYTFESGERLSVNIRGDIISVESLDVFSQPADLKQRVSYVITSIYKEKHSFVADAEGIKNIRVKIRDLMKDKKEIDSKIANLKKQIADYKLVSVKK